MQVVLLLLLALVAGANAFRHSPRFATRALQSSTRRLVTDPSGINGNPESAGEIPMDPDDPKLFDMNKRVRLGRSRDQDGKSNIWSIEPRMEVEESSEGSSKKNLLIVGAVIGAAIASLPLFQAFSSLVPDPADF